MLPLRYNGLIHAVGLTMREEGMKGLMRGYFAYILATSIYLMLVPTVAELLMIKSEMYGVEHNNTEKLEESVLRRQKEKAEQKRKERLGK